MNLTAMRLLKVTVGRERPFVPGCRFDPDSHEDCDDDDEFNASFFSGHASTAGTMAGLACAHHLSGGIFGGWKDAAVCGGAAGAALASGMLRVVSDDHHMTDVIVGWATGVAFGYVMPRWLYYDGRGRARSTLVVPTAGRDGAGLMLVHRF
jgi:membrane-associated phospholipid phosphatase